MKLSYRNEDYLETIYRLSLIMDDVGISDIARARSVTLPTVKAMITKFKKQGLVNQRHYGKVVLTNSGKKMAIKVYAAHKTLRAFLHKILGLPTDIADSEACRMEHGLGPETLKRLDRFVGLVLGCPDNKINCISETSNTLENDNNNSIKSRKSTMCLDDLKPGQTGKVIRVSGQGAIRRRLLDLGIRSGETIKMIKSAPLKDPLEIDLQGGHLSIRRSEAALISINIL